MSVIEFDGLQDIARALKETDRGLLKELAEDLKQVGDVVRDDARQRFTGGAARSPSIQRTADGFETRVRAGGQAHALVVVAQRLRKTTGTRPDYGALMVTRALLPARAAKAGEALRILEDGAVRLLREHGFAVE